MKPNKDILNLATKLANDKWLILPSVHKTMTENVARFLETGKIPEPEAHEQDKPFDTVIAAAQEETDIIAIVEVNGVLMKHPTMVDEMFGAMDVDSVKSALQDAIGDDTVKSIVMWFNSPGGTTTGIEELGRFIAQCPKPTVAFTDSMCASAAYWLASQCDEVVITPSACVGSVGVFALVLNDEKAMADAGLRVDAIYSGKYKLMGHTFHTLTTDERKILQDDVDKQHETFKNTILSRRPEISTEDMEGLTYEGQAAVEKHYADATVDSIDILIEKIGQTMKNEKEASAAKAVPKMETQPATVEAVATPTPEKKAEEYPQHYNEGDDKKKIPGLPGVNEDAPADPKDKDRDADEDGQKQDPSKEKYQEKDEEPDGDECTCEKCGGTGKCKKVKKAEDEAEPEKEDEKKAEDGDNDEDDKKEQEPEKKMEAPSLTTQAWREAIAGLKVDHGQLTMTKEANNLQGWRQAQESFRNQKS